MKRLAVYLSLSVLWFSFSPAALFAEPTCAEKLDRAEQAVTQALKALQTAQTALGNAEIKLAENEKTLAEFETKFTEQATKFSALSMNYEALSEQYAALKPATTRTIIEVGVGALVLGLAAGLIAGQ